MTPGTRDAGEPHSTLGAMPSAFLRLWSSYSLAETSAYLVAALVPLLAAAAFKATPFEMGVLATANTIPYLLFGPVVGVIADRVPRRRILIAADAVRASMLVTGVAFAFAGRLDFILLYIVAFGVASGNVWYDIAHGSYLPYVVTRERLISANTYLSISESGAYALGPVIAGVLLDAGGAGISLAVPAIFFSSSAALLYALSAGHPTTGTEPRLSLLADMQDGARFVITHKLLRTLTIRHMTWHFVVGGASGQVVLYLVRELGFSTAETGWLLSMVGAGTLAAALAAQSLSHRFGVGRAVQAANFAAAIAAWLVIAVPQRGTISTVAIGLGLFCHGFCTIVYQVNNASLRQAVTPDAMLGRMTAAVRVSTFGTNALGAIAAGAVAQQLGSRAALACVFLLAVLAAALGLTNRALRRMRALPPAQSAIGNEDG